MKKVAIELLTASNELFGGYRYMPSSLAMHKALYKNGEHVARVAVLQAGYDFATSIDNADVVLIVVERCPCCAGGAQTTVDKHPDKEVVTVCPLNGVDTHGDLYDFEMRESLSFFDPRFPKMQKERLLSGEQLPPDTWRDMVVDGIVSALKMSDSKTTRRILTE